MPRMLWTSALLAALLMGSLLGRSSPAMAGADNCPEPNNTREKACALGFRRKLDAVEVVWGRPDLVDRG